MGPTELAGGENGPAFGSAHRCIHSVGSHVLCAVLGATDEGGDVRREEGPEWKPGGGTSSESASRTLMEDVESKRPGV